jgi:pimeloyl-ACP methyl ester carboxylesterase
MELSLKKWKWVLAGGLLIACILCWSPLSQLFFAARLALSVQKLAAGESGQGLAVKESRIRLRNGSRDYSALIYRPKESPATSAIVLVAGLSELGCYHPNLVAFSRFLADKGLLVVTPDIQEFRSFRISAEPIEQILFWYKLIPTMEGGEKVRKAGLAGISFSGTLALMAAARPDVRNDVGFVLGIGPYYNLLRCTRNWFSAGSGTERTDYYPTRFYAKWIVMLAALDMVASPNDRQLLRETLNGLLLQKKIPSPREDLTPEGLRWYRLATMPAGQSDPELAQKIEDYLVLRIYPQLDPEDALNRLRCPAFLVHGEYDDLIPASESAELHRKMANSYLLVSPFLTHTHATDKPLSLQQKIGAVFDASIFFYQLSRALK